MIALLLAAQVVAAAPSIQLPEVPLVAAPRIAASPRLTNYVMRRIETPACAGAGRYYTSTAEPAALLRPQDERARGAVKRLIDMPMGRFCLTGGTTAEGR